LGSETVFPLWVEEKALFSFALGAFAFFVLFFLRAFALFFLLRARERESTKKVPAPTSASNARSLEWGQSRSQYMARRGP
jgi:hypothetical protein